MTKEIGAGREGTSGRWGAALRALRLRSNMKQDDAASRLQVSQSYVSRLENGVIAPSPEIIARLRTLLHNPVHRPLVDQLRAIVRHSPHAVALLALQDSTINVLEASRRFRNADPPFDAYRLGMDITTPLGAQIAQLVRLSLDHGAFEGEIACVELVWEAPLASGETRYCHSVQTPVFTGSQWLVHSATASISAAAYEAFVSENEGPECVHDF